MSNINGFYVLAKDSILKYIKDKKLFCMVMQKEWVKMDPGVYTTLYSILATK